MKADAFNEWVMKAAAFGCIPLAKKNTFVVSGEPQLFDISVVGTTKG